MLKFPHAAAACFVVVAAVPISEGTGDIESAFFRRKNAGLHQGLYTLEDGTCPHGGLEDHFPFQMGDL